MLTITQVNYIREMYFDKGLSVSEIEKRTTHSRNTINKYINLEDFNDKPYTRKKERKSDLIRPFVRQILLDDKHKRKSSAIQPSGSMSVPLRNSRNFAKSENERCEQL